MNTPETETPMRTATEFLILETTTEQLYKRLEQLERENITLRNAQKACEDCDAPTMEKVRKMESENAQLRKELEEARESQKSYTRALRMSRDQFLSDRDHFKSLAQTNWKMAEELAVDLKDTHDETGCFFSDCSTLLLLSRFQTLKQQQPK